MARIRVLIASDIRFYSDGLAQLLVGFPNLEVVATATGAGEAFKLAQDHRPDIVLVDVGMDQALTLLRDLDRVSPPSRKVAVAIRDEAAAILQWAEAGIAGFVTRTSSSNEVAEIIECVYRGELRCTPRIAAHLLNRVGQLAATQAPDRLHTYLTSREHEIARLVEQGLSNKQIARQLSIALPTVKNHVHRIFEKLDVKHRADAARSFRRHIVAARLVN